MKVSETWLREWVNPSLSGPQLAAQLTMAGLEVDGVVPVAGMFDHVIVAKVLKTSPHPQADRLNLCSVDTGSGDPIHVVCGASNVRQGLMVALALPGASLPGGVSIKESMIRGQPSQGMLCSGSELGFEEASEGIMELSADAPIGADLREYLNLNDQVLDIDLTPNRADCFSVLGIAREVAALNQLPLPHPPASESVVSLDALLPIHLNQPDACPQYFGRIIQGITPGAVTPFWMKERLRRSGIRSLHPVVDVTNYVMLELGQPMHAFDRQKIKGSVHVRGGYKNETLELLDGQKVTLDETVLVIADQDKPLAIAGVMGGKDSAVEAHTTDIFLESAFFNPLNIAGVVRRFGINSDSSQRFERGVDKGLQLIALERATALLKSIVGGEIGPIVSMREPSSSPVCAKIAFNPEKVKRLTGLDIPLEKMRQLLNDIGMEVESHQAIWSVSVPSYRFDLSLEEDLVEEIIRLYGYNNIHAEPLIAKVQAGVANPYERLLRRLCSFLTSRGYHETISYSFVDPLLQKELYPDAKTMPLLNPISSELSEMRVGMWPGLLASMVYNVHRQQPVIKCFEAGSVFDVHGKDIVERPCIAGLITGQSGGENWCDPTRSFDFYDMKGDLEALFSSLEIENVQFKSATHPALHPGQTAQIEVNGSHAGWLGVIHPRIADALDVNGDIVVFELSMSSLIHDRAIRYQPISKYPQIRRDLSLLVSNEVSAAEVEQAVREVAPLDWLKAFNVFDVYTGESIPSGKKSLAISLTLQDNHRTLVDAEISTLIDAILQKLDDKFAIILRTDAM